MKDRLWGRGMKELHSLDDVLLCTCMYVCMYVCMCIRMYLCIHIHIHMLHIHIYIYTCICCSEVRGFGEAAWRYFLPSIISSSVGLRMPVRLYVYAHLKYV